MAKIALQVLLVITTFVLSQSIIASDSDFSTPDTLKLVRYFQKLADSDVDSQARFLISGLLDYSLKGNWNKTFLNHVNYSNFKYDTIASAFDVLVLASANESLNLQEIQNATQTISATLQYFINEVFPASGNGRYVKPAYKTIYETLVNTLSLYDYNTFVNQTQCLEKASYDFHAIFLQIKWWGRQDMHKAGLLWGQFDLNMSNCSDHETQYSQNATYNRSQKFFFGEVTAKLGTNWSIDLVESVNNTIFNHETVLESLDVIAKNIEIRNQQLWTQAILSISSVINKLIQGLFPLKEEIPMNYTNVYYLLNATRALYADVETFSAHIDSVQPKYNLTDYIENKIFYAVTRDYSAAGFLWEKMNQMLLKNGTELGEDADMQAKLLVSGFLDTTMQGQWNKTFLRNVSYASFPYDVVTSALSSLSHIDFTNVSSYEMDVITNATTQLTYAFSLLINATFPPLKGSPKITPTYKRIYQQLARSIKNYQISAQRFVNKTLYLSITPQEFHIELIKIDFNSRIDLHRAGLLWGFLDSNLTNSSFGQSSSVKEQDVMAGKFFFGFSAAKLGKNWNRTIVKKITQDHFDYESIVYYLSIINDNIYDRWYLEWWYAVYGIYDILDDTISTLFPNDLVPENFTNIFDHLNNTRYIYSDLDTFSNYIDNVKDSVNLTDFLGRKIVDSMSRDNSSTGFLWCKFNEIIINGTFNSSKDNQVFLTGLIGKEINKNVDVLGILTELKNIDEHRIEHNVVKKSLSKIAKIINEAIEELFPLVGYGYKFGIEMRAVPEGFQEAYDRLRVMRDICSDFKGFKGFLKQNKEILIAMIQEILRTKDYELKGQKINSMSEFIALNVNKTKEFLGF